MLCHVRLKYLDIEPEEFGIPLTNTAMLIQYEVPPDAGLLWKSWDDGSQLAVYHGPSGQTYQLDELSAWVVKLLQLNSLTPQEISVRIVQEFGLEIGMETAQVDQYLENLLPRLCRLGLLGESVPCS